MPRPSASKTRPESLEAALRTPEAREAVFAFIEANTLEAAQRLLDREYGIKRSISAIGEWAEQRRAEIRFNEHLEKLRISQERASTVAEAVGDAAELTQANIALLAQGLMDAQIAGDEKAKKSAADLLFFALGGIAKNKQADAQMMAAKTAHRKFEFDAAKAALAAAADLQEIARSAGSEKDKIERAKERLFGARPTTVEAVSAE